MSQETDIVLLEALEQVIQSSLNQLGNDITIIGVISDVSDSGDVYYFKYQTQEYIAYNNSNLQLVKGDRVYITVPQGDFSLQKYIIGKEADGKVDSAKWTDPWASINIFQKFTKEEELKIDCGKPDEKIVGPVVYDFSSENSLQLLNKYDRLGISADFITNLRHSISGNYGLLCQIEGAKGGVPQKLEVALDSSKMFGSIYTFFSPVNQVRIIDISGFDVIKRISIWLYQMDLYSESYATPEGKDFPNIYEIESKNFVISFGFEKQQSLYDTILLSSVEGETYNYPITIAETNYQTSNNKTIQYIIYREDTSNAYLVLEKFNLLNHTWERVKEHNDPKFYSQENILKTENGKISVVDIELKTTSYRARLVQKINNDTEETLITSNTLTFTNAAPISDKDSITNMETIKIVASGCNGVHFSYDENNQLIKIKGKYEQEFSLEIHELQESEWVNITNDVQRLTFSRQGNGYDSMITAIDSDKKTYTIKTVISKTSFNNIIQASFVYKGVTYNLHKEILFGYQGTSGSDYTLIIVKENTNTKLEEGISLIPQIIDMKNIPVRTASGLSYTWTYVTKENGQETSSKKSIKINTPTAVKLELKCEIENKNYTFSTVASFGPSNYSGCNRVEYLSDGSKRYFKQPFIKSQNNTNITVNWKRDSQKDASLGIFDPLGISETLNGEKPIFYEFIQLDNGNAYMPIVYDYNIYSSSLVNKWDGKSLVADEKNNFVAANMMAVGSKNSNNQFSGILLGDYKGYADSSVAGLTGIYGFDKGEQAYAFREDGTAFIGKAGSGRIWFDGNKGIIASNSWFNSDGTLLENPGSGLKIDLDEAYLKAVRNSSNDCVKISPGEQVFFEVSTNAANPWGGTEEIACYLKFNSNGLTEISAAKISGIWLDGNNNFLRGTLDIATTQNDLTTRHATLSSIVENNVPKGVFKGYQSGDTTGVGACVVSGEGAALKFLGNDDNYVSVSNSSVNLSGNIIFESGNNSMTTFNNVVTFNESVHIGEQSLEAYIRTIVKNVIG